MGLWGLNMGKSGPGGRSQSGPGGRGRVWTGKKPRQKEVGYRNHPERLYHLGWGGTSTPSRVQGGETENQGFDKCHCCGQEGWR